LQMFFHWQTDQLAVSHVIALRFRQSGYLAGFRGIPSEGEVEL